MAIKPLLYTSLVLTLPLVAQAGTVTIVQGVPGNNQLQTPSLASPGFPLNITFSNLESQITALDPSTQANCVDSGLQCPSFNPNQYASQGVTISSPDGLLIYPFSDQIGGSAQIELFDPGATDNAGGAAACIANVDCDGTANITVGLGGGVNDLAVGLSDADPGLALTLNVLGATNNVLFSEDISQAIENAGGQAYFVAEDTTADIFGLQITQTAVTDGSGLALAEVEASPEPSSVLLLIGGGLAILGSGQLRKRARSAC